MASEGQAQRSLGKLVASHEAGPCTALFICDIQERFRETIAGYPAVIDTARRMVRPIHMHVQAVSSQGSGVCWMGSGTEECT